MRSPETKSELISELTILVIAVIENEFEQFFVNAYGFGKLANNGEGVVNGIVHLILTGLIDLGQTKCENCVSIIVFFSPEFEREGYLSSASNLLQFCYAFE